MSEQEGQAITVQRPTTDGRDEWKAYWSAQGMSWRTEPEIDEERQQFLGARRTIGLNTDDDVYSFRDENGSIALSRADVEWLLATHDNGRGPVNWQEEKGKAPSEMREGINLSGANLQGVDLSDLPLTCLRSGLSVVVSNKNERWQKAKGEQAAICLKDTNLTEAHLERAALSHAHLERADLSHAHLNRAFLPFAHMADAILDFAEFDGANLGSANLEKVSASNTSFQGAQIEQANLQSGTFWVANFRGASLWAAILTGALFWRTSFHRTCLLYVQWTNATLLGIDWAHTMLGEEYGASIGKFRDEDDDTPQAKRLKEDTIYLHKQAEQALVQVGAVLRVQGHDQDADELAYRGKVMHRRILWLQRRYLSHFGALLLDLISGYGYKPFRSFITYVLMILGFACVYFAFRDNEHPALTPPDALIFSVTSFH